MVQEIIQLKAIEAISPTLAETLRLCKLRAGLSRAAGASEHVLGNPKAWLGTAYHAVLEAVGRGHGNDIDARSRDLWNAAIELEYERSRAHPFDKRFGPPESWPGYHMVAAMTLVRARKLVKSSAGQNRPPSDKHAGGVTWREKKFSAANGKIVGRPDVVRRQEVADFKTGDLFEDEDQEQVKAAYVRQLRLYAYLVKETLGWWPRRGVLLPMLGSPLEVGLEAGECEAEAEEAIRLLNEYNEVLANTADPFKLATPSRTSCSWCQYQLYCPAFWGAVVPDWTDSFRSAAIAGRAISPPHPIYGGSAFSLSLNVEEGSVSPGETISLFPLDSSIHEDVPLVDGGDRVRVTGLWRRADNSLVATKRTLISRETALPRCEIEA